MKTHPRSAAPAPSGATRKPYYLHCFHADPFARLVVLVVGDYKASFKEIDRKFKLRPNLPKADRVPFTDGLAEVLEKNPPKGDLEHCGRTVQNDGLDVFVWFPAFPTPGTLVHELMHAKDDILNSAGVTDTSGETDAYLLGQMYDHFFAALEKDKAQEDRK